MGGYDTEARLQWQKTLKELENQIDTVWLITQSSLIKMGASVMSLFTKLKIQVVRSESEIRFK
jgi:phosphopantetheine adenylyltransferase